MFADAQWLDSRTSAQYERFNQWTDAILEQQARLVVIEIGAGTAVPSVRITSDHIIHRTNGILIRINPYDADVPDGHTSIPLPALQAIKAIT